MSAATETGEVAPLAEREALACRVARRRLRTLHAALAGRRQDWANNTAQPCPPPSSSVSPGDAEGAAVSGGESRADSGSRDEASDA